MENYSVYQHVNKENGKRYIGITSREPEKRWGTDGNNYKSTPYFWNAIQKYGWDGFDHEVLFSGMTKEEACSKEIELIRKYNTQNKDFGYNVLSGGEAPSIPEEIRRKMSEAMMGNKNGEGIVFTKERRQHISEALKGKPFTEEHRQNISKAKKGKPHKSISEDARKKISDAHDKKPVYCDELDTVFPSIQESARQLGLHATLICKCCKGTLHTTGGYHFKYA